MFSAERNNLPYKVVCYYQPEVKWFTIFYFKLLISFSNYAQFPAEDINLNVCTHLNYAFAILVNGTIHLGNPKHDVGEKGIYNWNNNLYKKIYCY